ncbi:MAG: SDR family oxidoreductase [Candidatus Solibacter sp.]
MDLAGVEVGATANLTKKITDEDIQSFARLSGDYNPLHVDRVFAAKTSFQRPVAHGMLLASYVSTMIGMQLPGPGALWMKQSFQWSNPVFAGDTVELRLKVTHKSVGTNIVTLEVEAVNQDGKVVMNGEGAVKLLERREQRQEQALSERVVLVTGGGRGIGAAVAKVLARLGATIVVNYRRDAASAVALVDELRAGGGRAIAAQADVMDVAGIRGVLDLAQSEFHRQVDVLVNNASLPFVPRKFLELGWQDVQDLLDVQVRGAFNACQAVLPSMIERRSGCIVNIGSVLTRDVPPEQWSAFVMSKSALLGLTRSLAAEFGPQGIRVNMVSPGTTETESTSVIPERLRKVQAMQTPLRRLARPQDIAQAVAFLCSPESGFVTGIDLPVCGGMTL